MALPAAILDIDGTLVDTNYQHALAWFEAFRQQGEVLPVWRLHRSIGKGGDQLVTSLMGEAWDEEHGDAVRAAESTLYMAAIRQVEPFDGARELVARLADERDVVLASSAKEPEVDHYLDLLDAREAVTAWTTSADVERTKPEPDLVHAALERVAGAGAVMVGDTPWDVEAARRADVSTIAVVTGGFSRAELVDAGAVAVYDSVRELLDRLGETALGGA